MHLSFMSCHQETTSTVTHIPTLEMLECETWHMLASLRHGLWLSEEGKSRQTTDSAAREPCVSPVTVGRQAASVVWGRSPADGGKLGPERGKSWLRQ